MRENENEECVQNYCGDVSKIENYDSDCYNNTPNTYPQITCDVVLRLNSKICCYY